MTKYIYSSDAKMSQLNYMLDDALPFVIQTMDSKQANKFKTCQGNVFKTPCISDEGAPWVGLYFEEERTMYQ